MDDIFTINWRYDWNFRNAEKCVSFINEPRREKTGFLNMHLCFRYTDSKIPLLHKSDISNLYPSSVIAQPGLRGTWSKNPEDRFSHNEAQISLI